MKVTCLGALALGFAAGTAHAFDYGPDNVDVAAHWAARANLASAVMFSGLGEPITFDMAERDEWLRRAGFVVRPPMPDMAVVGAVYALGEPRFVEAPDFADPGTLRWDAEAFDRTLDPGAQAWALVKITAPVFHLVYHETREDKLAALMMIPQAREQARALQRRLGTEDGLFAALHPDGRRGEPSPRDQAAVLWGTANLVLAATSELDDYWHEAYRNLVRIRDYRPLLEHAFEAVQALPPATPAGRAIVVQALGRYTLATEQPEHRAEALDLARRHADALAEPRPDTLEDLGLAVYGLAEAGRLLSNHELGDRAAALFAEALLPLWDEAVGVFRPKDGELVYTPRVLGALVAALNAMRWHGPKDLAGEADRLYPRLFQSVLVEGGMLQASPLALVAEDYFAKEPEAHFAHPDLPAPEEVGRAPVFASEVRHENGAWRVTDGRFVTADALFLANMLVMRLDGEADAFLSGRLLPKLR
jgi:hypothetical protein